MRGEGGEREGRGRGEGGEREWRGRGEGVERGNVRVEMRGEVRQVREIHIP